MEPERKHGQTNQIMAGAVPARAGALQLDIFSWNAGESRGAHYLDDFRNGSWVVGLAQEADDPKKPELENPKQPLAQSGARASRRLSPEREPRRWPEWEMWGPDSEDPVRDAEERNESRKGRWFEMQARVKTDGNLKQVPPEKGPRKEVPPEKVPPEPPKTHWQLRPDVLREEPQEYTDMPVLKMEGYDYDQVGYLESLGNIVVNKNGQMVYAKSHACSSIKILASETIRSQQSQDKWDMCSP